MCHVGREGGSQVSEEVEKPDDVLDERSLREVLSEEGQRAKEQVQRVKRNGWKPFRDLAGKFAGTAVDAVQSLADGLSGEKRR